MMKKTSPIKVPMIQPTMPPPEEYIAEIASIWITRKLTNMSPKHQKLEEALQNYLDVRQFQLFVNGHQALECIIQALNLKGEVITTPFTFVSTIHAIVRCGLKPVFCDVCEDNFTIDVSKIEGLITEKTSAIIPVHVYGMVCDVEGIQNIADKHNLKVIYDAAHAFGVQVKGKGIGSFGDAAMFSFHATKTYHTIEGGALAFHDTALSEQLLARKDFGITGPESVEYVAGNSKLDEFRAAMGLCNLRHIEEEIEKRKRAAERYDMHFSNVAGIQRLPVQKGVTKNYSYYPIVLNGYKLTRNALYEKLREKGILTRKYFYPLCNELECYRGEYGDAEVPIARLISENVLCLPMFAGLTDEQVDFVCDAILK